MAEDTLTRNKSGQTILTENFVNSFYGGLYGQPEGATLDENHPLVAGHIHDGQHLDGHAQKIDLSQHVTGQLDGQDIQDGSISVDKLDPDIDLLTSCCGLLLLTNDGRLIIDSGGNILLKEIP
jgi:hypothetical protein